MIRTLLVTVLLSGTALLNGGEVNLLTTARVAAAGAASAEKTPEGAVIFKVNPGVGWPQLEIDRLPPCPEGMTDLRLAIQRISPARQSFGVSVDGTPRDSLKDDYITAALNTDTTAQIMLPILNSQLSGIRIACKSPDTAAEYRIEGLFYERAKTLAEGWSFETPADSGRFAGHAEISGEYAFRGRKSLKLDLPSGREVATIYPGITDWRPYKQLRFTLYNPKPQPHQKYRSLIIGGEYLPENCSIPSGLLQVRPETAQEFILDLDTLAPGQNRAKIETIQIFKGSPETVFYLDEIKLYTPAEVEAMTTGKNRQEIEKTITAIDAALPQAGGGIKKELETMRTRLGGALDGAAGKATKELQPELTAARELATLAAALPVGGTAPLALSGAPATEKIFRDTEFKGAPEIHLYAAGHERESFQVVALPREPLTNVSVTATPLKGPNGAEIAVDNIAINPVGYIELTVSNLYSSSRVGFWPDILVHNQKLNLARRLQPYWITVYVPSGQRPGEYRGEIRFTADNGVTAAYAYTVHVYRFSLPVKGECLTFFDWRHTPADPAIRRKCYSMMLDNRLNPTGMYINGQSPDGKAKAYEFSPHPDDLEYCVKRGMNVLAIWFLYNGGDKKNPHNFDEAYLTKVKNFLDYYKPILEAKGAWDIAMINGFDEIMHQEKAEVERRLAEARKICSWLKRDYPGIKICNVGNKMTMPGNLMDIWYLGPMTKQATRDIRENGGTVCFYSVYGNPSPMLDLPGIAARMLAWQAFKEDAKGIGYYSTYRPWGLGCRPEDAPTGVDWSSRQINAQTTNRTGRNGDGNLFYPDRNGGILASTRIHNLRDGVEDYEYLALLRKLDPRHKLLSIPDTITTLEQDDYTKDSKVIAAYRHAVAQAIEAKLPASR